MRFSQIYRIGREKSTHVFTLLTIRTQSKFYNCYLKVLLKGASLSLLPTIALGCSEGVLSNADDNFIYDLNRSSHISFHQAKESTLDILIFNDDALQRLDSYQRVERFSGNSFHATSTGGKKIIFLYLGSRGDRYKWAEMNSYSALDKIYCNLEDENRDMPLMTGCNRCDAGDRDISIDLTPLSCSIILESIRCDFSGTPYAGKTISDAKVYLTYVNAVSSIGDGAVSRTRLINTGMLNSYDMKGFKDKSLVYQELASGIGNQTTRPEKSFLCYPEGSGTSIRTRLVIEGKIDGETYFWPIEACGGDALKRAAIYTYNILIRRKGTSDPDVLIEPQVISVKLEKRKWSEKENYPIQF